MARSKTKAATGRVLKALVESALSTHAYRPAMHFNDRKAQHDLDDNDVSQIFGTADYDKSTARWNTDHHDWNYAIDGYTVDGMHCRVAFAFEGRNRLVLISIYPCRKKRRKQ